MARNRYDMKLLVLAFLIIWLFVGCTNKIGPPNEEPYDEELLNKELYDDEQINQERSQTEHRNEKSSTTDIPTMQEDNEESIPTITWMVDRLSGLNRLPEDSIKLFNDKLKEKGYEFKLKLIVEDYSDYFSYENIERFDIPELAKSLNVDIFNVGMTHFTDRSNYYYEYVHEGIFLPLNEYLETDEGKLAKAAIPEKVWKTHMLGDNIYTVSLYADYPMAFGYTFNMDIARQYNLSIPDRVTKISDLEELLEEVQQKCQDKVIPLCIVSKPLLKGFDYFLGSGTLILFNQETEIPIAINAMENPYILDHLQTLKRFKEKGLIKQYDKNPTSMDFNVFERGKVFVSASYLYPQRELQRYEDIDSIIEYNGVLSENIKFFDTEYRLSSDSYILPHNSSVNGITSWSEHPREAFQLLCALATDEELAQILLYGIEGQDYQINDNGRLTYMEDRGRGILASEVFGNRVKGPVFNPVDNIDEMYENTPEFKLLTMPVNVEEFLNELNSVSKINEKYEYLWKGESQDLSTELYNFKKELEEAGIDKVIDSINKQIEEWWNKK
ncbi:MAG: putative secreted protein [Herbinix sp.]|jgi:putative aldouronate transport system substrate-binding protein|nr:putative secreted protein [Herbinix sp.]